MDNPRRLIVFFVITFAILLLTNLVYKPKPKPSPAKADSVATRTVVVPETRQDTAPAGETEIVVDRPAFKAVFSNLSGSLKSFYLKEYDAELVPAGQRLFTTAVDKKDLGQVAFDHAYDGQVLVFTKEIDGTRIEKRIIFNHPYGFDLTVKTQPGPSVVTGNLDPGLALTEVKNKADDLKHYAVYAKGQEFRNLGKDKKNAQIWHRSPQWVGFRTKYFFLVLANKGQIDSMMTIPLQDKRVGLRIYTGSNSNLTVYGLPIKYGLLKKFDLGLEEIAKGGIFGPIARFFMAVLESFNRVLRNYGLAIILFALIVKGVFMPLSLNMVKAQKKMQMIQPEIKKIQQRYKDNPGEMNREVMAMYKAYKVNPVSGCLPLLIQIPIFMALYSTLSSSIELRRAPFLLWIGDLSLKDPYYVLPITMGVMSIVQSLFTLTDPRQRMMVILMPVFMTYIFLFMPSGLQLYWFIYTVFSLIEQFVVKRSGGSK